MSSTKAFTYSGMTIPTIVALSYFNYAISACVGGLFTLAGLINLGTLASYLVFVRQSAMPMNQFTLQINALLVALASAERIFDMMEEEPELDEGTVTLCKVKINNDGTLTESELYTGDFAWKVPINEHSILNKSRNVPNYTFVLLKGDVHFKDVVFGYHPEHPILNKINLFAKPSQKIAFVGSTGAGKTTIINLINLNMI